MEWIAIAAVAWTLGFMAYLFGYSLGHDRGRREGSQAVLALLSRAETEGYIAELVEAERAETAPWN